MLVEIKIRFISSKSNHFKEMSLHNVVLQVMSEETVTEHDFITSAYFSQN